MDRDLETIASQTNIKDYELIRAAYIDSNKDIVSTIVTLMNIKDVTPPSKPRTIVDDMRDILSEKEELFKLAYLRQKQ